MCLQNTKYFKEYLFRCVSSRCKNVLNVQLQNSVSILLHLTFQIDAVRVKATFFLTKICPFRQYPRQNRLLQFECKKFTYLCLQSANLLTLVYSVKNVMQSVPLPTESSRIATQSTGQPWSRGECGNSRFSLSTAHTVTSQCNGK